MQNKRNFKPYTRRIRFNEQRQRHKEKSHRDNRHLSPFDMSTIYKPGDRFTFNGETYEVANCYPNPIIPKEEKGCAKRPFETVKKDNVKYI